MDESARRPGSLIETPRLWLREQTMDDLDDLAAILCDRETMSFYPRPFSRADALAWMERNLRRYDELGYGLWAMILKDDGSFIGQCGLTVQTVESVYEVEAGWHVNRAYWRSGFATEAARSCRDYGFEVIGLERLVSIILPANVASQGVARNIGMTPERTVTHAGLPHLLFTMRRPTSSSVDQSGSS
jgi:RimJ/RimL family protein N-acetyltransferase